MTSIEIKPSPEAAPGPASPKPAPAPRERSGKRHDKVVLRRHFDLLYWWAVWLYAGFAAAMTWSFGIPVTFGDKTVLMYPGAWLGVGFVAMLLFVAIFTAVRARGAMSLIMVLTVLVIGVVMFYTSAFGWIGDRLSLFRVHLNLGFYVAILAIMLPVWISTTLIFNRFTYYTFEAGRQVSVVRPLSGGVEAIAAHTLSIRRLPDDLFVHRLLGAPFFGTGDIEIGYTRPDGSAHKELINNVTQAGRKLNEINRLLH